MDVNIIDKDKETIIHKGIIAQNIIFVTEALKRINKTTLNYQNKNGYTALIRALLKTNIPLIKEIMKYKPDLTLEDSGGLTAAVFASAFKIDLNDLITPEFKSLKTAIKNNNLTEVELLLDKLTYINETDSNENTILMYAVATTNNLEIVKAILKKNPDLSIKNLDKKTALDIAKVSKKRNMIELLDGYKSANVKPRLLKPISSFNPQVKPVKSVTMEPIKEEENESSKELLEVLDAIREDNLNRVKALLDSLKDINEVTPGGWTILNFIVFGNHNLEILKEILKKNPDLSIKTPRGETTLELAKRRERTEMIKLLESYSSKPVNVKSVNVNVRPINANVRPINANVRPVNVNVRPVNVNVKPKGRNSKCDIVDTLTVTKINEVFTEINKPIPAGKILKAERLKILKDLLGC
jgi:ankyrin repeat protein